MHLARDAAMELQKLKGTVLLALSIWTCVTVIVLGIRWQRLEVIERKVLIDASIDEEVLEKN